MKLHRTLVEAVAGSLHQIFQEGWYADKVIERMLKSNPRWGSRDRAFIAENTYEIVRWWRLLWAYGFGVETPPAKITQEELIRLVGVNVLRKGSELPDWVDFVGLSREVIEQRKAEFQNNRAIVQSIPDWLDEMVEPELGEKWNTELTALNDTAQLVIRVNSLKTTKGELGKLLHADGWTPASTPLSGEALVLKRGSVFQSPHFQKGLFEIQDAGSQCIAPFLHVEPGMRVVDACAGAGGKSLHLAALMENKGSIISLDTEAWKLEELRKRARRSGAHIIQGRPIESSKTIKRLYGTADRLLLDVPCSGLGTLRRNPDAKWKLSSQFLDSVRVTQAEILRSYSKILKPGGQLVYATCSILPSENERQVERFLAENPNFKLQEERKILPSEHGFDGFYMARLALDA